MTMTIIIIIAGITIIAPTTTATAATAATASPVVTAESRSATFTNSNAEDALELCRQGRG